MIGRILAYGIMYVGHTGRRCTVLPRQIRWNRKSRFEETRDLHNYLGTYLGSLHVHLRLARDGSVNDIPARYMTLTESGLRQSTPGTMLAG